MHGINSFNKIMQRVSPAAVPRWLVGAPRNGIQDMRPETCTINDTTSEVEGKCGDDESGND